MANPVSRPAPVARPGGARVVRTAGKGANVVDPLEANKELQRELQREGLYSGPIDGVIGGGTRGALDKLAKIKERRAQERAAQAKADAERQEAAAKAEAAKAAAEAKRAEVEAERERLKQAEVARKADAERRADEAKEAEKQRQDRARQEAVDLGIKAGAIAIGAGGGIAVSKGVNKLVEKSITSAAPALQALAKEARSLVPKAKPGTTAAARLAGIVRAFDAQKLARLRGPAGIILGSSLIVEGVAARLFAQNEANPTFQKIGTAFGAASVAAGLTVIGKDLYARASPTVRPNAAHVQVLEGARNVLGGVKDKAPSAFKPASPAAKAAGDLSKRGRGAVGPSVKTLRAEAKAAGIANASRMSKAEIIAQLSKASGKGAAQTAGRFGASAILKGAAKGVTRALPILAVGLSAWAGYQYARKSAEKGDNVALAALKGLGLAAADFATFGLAGLAVEAAEATKAPAKPASNFVEQARQGVAEIVAPDGPWDGATPTERHEAGMAAISEASNMTGLFAGRPEHGDVAARSQYQVVAAEFARGASARVPPTPPPQPIREVKEAQGPTGAPRGFQLAHVREAALKARLAKG